MTTKVISCSHGAERPREMQVKGASLLQIQANWMVNAEKQEQSNMADKEKEAIEPEY